jgi:hypothetical protein
MSQIRLYFDEDAGQRSVVQALRNLKIDVITTWEDDKGLYLAVN